MDPREDFRRRFVVEAWEYFRTKIPNAPPEELEGILRAFRAELKWRLSKLPVVRIWPDQWFTPPRRKSRMR